MKAALVVTVFVFAWAVTAMFVFVGLVAVFDATVGRKDGQGD